MKILWASNAPWAKTGYGKQTEKIVTALANEGHDLAILSLFGLQGSSITWRGMQVYPTRRSPLGEDIIGACAEDCEADIVVTLYDVWAFDPEYRWRFEPPWMAWIPIDGWPISERMMKRIRTVDFPVAMSLYGRYLLHEDGVDAPYIPCGIDCKVFRPSEPNTMRGIREKLGLDPDAFIITSVGANKGFPARKSWAETLTAFSLFKHEVPEAFLYLHTTKQPLGSRGEGIYFENLMRALKLPPDSVGFPDQNALAIGVPDEQMALIYQATNVLLQPSMGEGFGIPIIEAQACGVPVITQKCTAMEELVANGELINPLQPVWIPQLDYWWYSASVERILEALHTIRDRTDQEMRDGYYKGIAMVAEDFDWPEVLAKHWLPLMDKVEDQKW